MNRRHLVDLGACICFGVGPALAVSQVEIGILTCDASAGIDTTKEISLVCDFHAVGGPPEAYSAIIKKHDLPSSASGHIVWTVTAKKAPDHSGSLAGDYVRTSSALIGGASKAFTLQPARSIDGSSENFAHAVSRMTVIASN